MKKIIVLSAFVFMLFAVTVGLFAIGLYFLEDNFVTNDAAPLADPHTTEPGGQSVDAVEVDGTMAIANGKLTFTAQSTPADGDLGLRYTTTMPDFIGRAIFYKIQFSSLSNGNASYANAAQLFGVGTAADVSFLTLFPRAFGTTSSQFISFTDDSVVTDFNWFIAPNTTDVFYVTQILGGASSADSHIGDPWYSGQAPTSYPNGCFYFLKKSDSGQWLLQGKSYDIKSGDQHVTIASYNGAFSVDRWAVSNDTLRDGYLNPVFYQSANAANVQLFDDTPEVGAAFDSVKGNWEINSNMIRPTGAAPGAPINWLTTTTMSDDDVLAEERPLLVAGGGGGVSLVFRWDGTNSHHILFQIADGAPDNIRFFTFESGSYTQRSITTGMTLPAGNDQGYLAAAIYDSAGVTTMNGWYNQTTNTVFTTHYTHSTTFNTGHFKHGLRHNNTVGWHDAVRFYPLGTDNEHNGLDVYFATDGRRRFIVQ